MRESCKARGELLGDLVMPQQLATVSLRRGGELLCQVRSF
jgi:hypothetical protein